MNRLSSRGQTEPLAALVAVAAVCFAFTLYTGVVTDTLSALGSDRDTTDATTERVWDAIDHDGVFDNSTVDIQHDIEQATLPQGQYVSINVTHVGDDGRLVSIDGGQFDPQGDPIEVEPPPSAETFERSIPIRHRRGKIRPGRLVVVVWE